MYLIKEPSRHLYSDSRMRSKRLIRNALVGKSWKMSKVVLQQKAPNFSAQAVVNGEFKEVCLDDYKGKYLILFFYPLDWTFVCPTEIIAFSDKAEEFKKIGVEIVGCSIDSKFSHFNWINTPRKQGGLGEMKIPLLADVTKQIAKDYGVLIEKGGDAGLAAR